MIRAFGCAATLAGSGALACEVPPDALVLSSEIASAPAAYAMVKDVPISAPFAMEIGFCADGSEAPSKLGFDAIMPAHQHGMNFTVDVATLDANRFEVSNVVFHMPGLWQVQVKALIGGQQYDYTAEVAVQ